MNEHPDGGILAALGTVAGAALLYVWHKLSPTARREGQAHRDMISTLEHERDAANERADAAAAEAARERELRTKVELHNVELAGDLRTAESMLRKAVRKLPPQEQAFFKATEFGDLT